MYGGIVAVVGGRALFRDNNPDFSSAAARVREIKRQ
jgi:hypothetical protein